MTLVEPCGARCALALMLVLGLSMAGCSGGGDDGGGGGDGGGSPDGGGDGDGGFDGGPTGGGFRAINLPTTDERITGIACTSARACVVSTDVFGGEGHIYATDGRTITGTPVTGDEDFAGQIGGVNDINFLGFERVEDRLVARVRGMERAFVSATGDPRLAASWSIVSLGIPSADTELGLNSQYAFAENGGRWLLLSQGRILEAFAPPAAATPWTNIWSPQATPSIPADIDDQREADPTICNTDPHVAVLPTLSQPSYVARDLSLVIAPAGSVNQEGDDAAGVCISTNGGALFRHVAFPDVEQGHGPLGVTCIADHCIAYGGLEFADTSLFVFVTDNASSGAESDWRRATIPGHLIAGDARLRHAAFAPDGQHGFIVGAASAGEPLLLATTDGGETWTDETDAIRTLAPDVRLHAVYALDADHVWIGGERSTLLTIGD